jgi:glycosyltransferase involved in cell wall biosynthesis
MKLSVVIPCRNEEKFIAECIDAIYANNLNEEVELSVVVVDGMSDDGTQEIINQLALKYSNLYTVDNVAKLTPYAFNLGIKFKEADYYQIVGARQILSSNYLSTAIQKLQANQEIWCIGGAVENVYVNEVGEIIAKAMSTTFGMGLGNFRTLEESSFSDTVGTPMYPKVVFERIGYFDEDLVRNQDDDYNFRVTKAGGKIWLETSITIKYYVRATFQGLFRQFYQYGYWKVFVNTKHKTVTTMRQLVPPIFVLYVSSLSFAFLLPYPFNWMYFLGGFAYLVMLLYSSLNLVKKGNDFFLFIRTFLTLHFSYGVGYLHGIINFIILKRKPSQKQMKLSR